MTNLTPAQLEQFESTFRYFDRDESNTLEFAEMTGALASLGIIFPVYKIIFRFQAQRSLFALGRQYVHALRPTRPRLRGGHIRSIYQYPRMLKPLLTEPSSLTGLCPGRNYRRPNVPGSAARIFPRNRPGQSERPHPPYVSFSDRGRSRSLLSSIFVSHICPRVVSTIFVR